MMLGRRLALLVVALAAFGAAGAQLAQRQDDARVGADLAADYASARELLDGRDPYSPTLPDAVRRHVGHHPSIGYPADQANPHSPAMISIVVPLARSSWGLVRSLWLAASLLALSLSCYLLARRLGFARLPSMVATLVLISLPMTQDALANGAVEPLLLPLVIVGALDLQRGRAKRAGLLFGVVVAVKLYPVVFTAALVRRHRAAFVWTAATAAVFFLSGSIITGTSPTHFLDVVRGEVASWGTAALNIGIPALILKGVAGTFGALPSWAPAFHVVCLAGAVVWVVRRRHDVWGAIPAVLLAPIVWNSYFIFSFPALLRQARQGMSPWLPAAVVGIGISWSVPGYDAIFNTLGPLFLLLGEGRVRAGSSHHAATRVRANASLSRR